MRKKNLRNKGIYIGSRTSPKGSSRACLCWDSNTYSISCCDGSISAQGIGSITGVAPIVNEPLTDATFNQAITDILAQDPNGDYDLVPYGKIQDWNTSQVTDMSYAFESKPTFNGDISNWNTSSVTNMSYMFFGASNFNGNIGNWNTSSVINMTAMFTNAVDFNQPLNSWDVSNVFVMASMFLNANVFNQPLNNWDVSSVENMTSMFRLAQSFNQPLNSWVVSQVINCSNFSNGATSWVLPKPNFTNCTE